MQTLVIVLLMIISMAAGFYTGCTYWEWYKDHTEK